MSKRIGEIMIEVGNPTRLFLDGEEFPYDVLADDLVMITQGGSTFLRVSIVADRGVTKFVTMPSQPPVQDHWAGVKKGDIVKIGGTPEPQNIYEFRQVGEQLAPILRRLPNGRWAWFDEDEQWGDDTWEEWVSSGVEWSKLDFEVTKVREG